ncbi:MAG: hypothetical protein H0V80_14350 [Acidobacteria bacterium]|nr:hypothetical protein [Acidobacteriota bacterium]
MSPSERLAVPAQVLGVPARALDAGDLVLANRLVTLELVLPNITHEINNALQVIGGLGEIIATRPGISEDVAQKLQRIHGQAVRCSGLLRDLLGYARRDEASPITDVPRCLDRALNLRRYHLSRARVTVQIDPETEGPVVARMDSQHFEQVLVNLVVNAEQSLAGHPDPVVRVAYARDAADVVLTVHDSGPGIDPSQQETYFQPFMTTRSGALGLGLTASRALAHAAGGTVAFVGPAAVQMRVPAG